MPAGFSFQLLLPSSKSPFCRKPRRTRRRHRRSRVVSSYRRIIVIVVGRMSPRTENVPTMLLLGSSQTSVSPMRNSCSPSLSPANLDFVKKPSLLPVPSQGRFFGERVPRWRIVHRPRPPHFAAAKVAIVPSSYCNPEDERVAFLDLGSSVQGIVDDVLLQAMTGASLFWHWSISSMTVGSLHPTIQSPQLSMY
jgi:hypothetical protein